VRVRVRVGVRVRVRVRANLRVVDGVASGAGAEHHALARRLGLAPRDVARLVRVRVRV